MLTIYICGCSCEKKQKKERMPDLNDYGNAEERGLRN